MKTVLKKVNLTDALECVRNGQTTYILFEMTKEDTTVLDLLKSDGFVTLAPADPEEQKPQPKAKPKTTAKKATPSNGVDHGKIVALHKAGWSTAKIADEMGCSGQTVLNHLAKENDGAGKDPQP